MFTSFQKRIYWCVLLLVRCLIAPIHRIIHLKKLPQGPIISNQLLLKTACSLAKKIRTRQVTSEEVVQVYISRIRAVNPFINAVVEDRFELAVRAAQDADVLVHSGEKSETELEEGLPFLGVPFTVKECIALKGMSHTGCDHRQRGRIASTDASVVRLMRAAGAIPLLVSSTPELCMDWETHNGIIGVTRNPYDARRTVGGSSGGEAALLSAAASVMGIGSDLAGSGRLPAFFTGTFGHKPTPGVVPIDGLFPTATDKDFVRFATVCPMTRYAEDLLPMLRVLAPENLDKLQLDVEVEVKNLKIYYMEDDSGSKSSNRVNPEITEAMRSAVAYLDEKFGIKAKKVCFENLKHGLEYASTFIMGLNGFQPVSQETNENAEDWNSILKEFAKYFFCSSKRSYNSLCYGVARRVTEAVPEDIREKLREELTALHFEIKGVLGGDGVLLYPTFTDFAHFHYESCFRWLNTTYMSVWNVLELPVTQCPLGLGRNGLPMGIQLVGAPYSDRLTLALAREFEAAFGGWVPPPHATTTTAINA